MTIEILDKVLSKDKIVVDFSKKQVFFKGYRIGKCAGVDITEEIDDGGIFFRRPRKKTATLKIVCPTRMAKIRGFCLFRRFLINFSVNWDRQGGGFELATDYSNLSFIGE